MKDLVATKLPDKLSIATQARILLGHLDPKYRIIPVIDRNITVAAQLRYAIAQSNFRIDGIILPKKIEKDLTPLLIQIATCFCYHIIKYKEMANATNDVETVKIYGMPIKSLLKNPTITTNYFVKALQCAMGYPITMSHQTDNMIFSPHLSSYLRIIKEDNLAKVTYHSYKGIKTVFLSMED